MAAPIITTEVRLQDGSDVPLIVEPPSPADLVLGGELVWRPGGVPGPGVTTSWLASPGDPGVAAIVAHSPVPVTVYVDSSLAAAVVPGSSGVTPLGNTTTFRSYAQGFLAGGRADTMTIADGATLNRPRAFLGQLQVNIAAVTTAAMTFDTTIAGVVDTLELADGAALVLEAGAGVAAILVPAGGELSLLTRFQPALDTSAAGAVELIDLAAGATLVWNAYSGMTLHGSNIIVGAGSAAVNFIHDATVPIPPLATWGMAGAISETLLNPAAGTDAYNPVFMALTTIGLDPVAGLDTNVGSVASPMKSLNGIVQRWGGLSPVYPNGQSVVISLINSQPAGVDAITISPQTSGGGSFAVIGVPVVVQAAFVAGVITQPVKAIAGSPLTVAAVPAGVVAGVMLWNSTRNSYAFVDSIVAGTAHVQQPMTAASVTTIGTGAGVADNTWATGDTLTAYTLPNWNATLDPPGSGNESAGGAASVAWTQWVTIADPSGTGASVYRHTSRCTSNVLSMCKVNTRLHTSAQSGRGTAVTVTGCTMLGGGNAHLGGNSEVYGGGYLNGMVVAGPAWEQTLGTIIHGAFSLESSDAALNGFYSDGSLRVVTGGFAQWLSACWGTFVTNLQQGAVLCNNSGSTWLLGWLTNGAMTIGTLGTATVYDSGGVMTDGVVINPTNIDAGGSAGPGMYSVTNGSRYCNVN